MNKIKFRQTRRRCSIAGCRNLNAKLFARSEAMDHSVWLCDECVKDIYTLLYPVKPSKKAGDDK